MIGLPFIVSIYRPEDSELSSAPCYDKISESSGLSKVKIGMDSELNFFLDSLLPPENFRVVNFPDIILLCGGPAHEENSISFRNFLKKNDLSKNYLLPEDIKEWNQYDMYSDLLSFEEDLGSIISSVVLFVESEGSIAELGAFSKIASISNKLLVIVDEKHYEQDSFIKLGPVKFLENEYEQPIVCDFLENGNQTEIKYGVCISDIKLEIDRFTQKVSEAKFNLKNIAHVSLLIYEILTYFNILTSSEIKEVLEYCSISTDQKFLNRCFFLLDKMDMVEEKNYMRTKYYIPLGAEQYVKFAFQKNRFIDKINHASKYFDAIKSIKDNPRVKALNSYKKRGVL